MPRLALSVGLGPVWIPQKTAHTEQLSTTVRDHSIWPLRDNQFGKAKWIKSQIPAPAGHRRAATHFLWQYLPRNAAAKYRESLSGKLGQAAVACLLLALVAVREETGTIELLKPADSYPEDGLVRWKLARVRFLTALTDSTRLDF